MYSFRPFQRKSTLASSLNENTIHRIEEQIGYSFRNKHLLRLAFIHASVHYDMETWDKITESTKTDLANNERLEFLGDGIFNFLIAEFLFTWFPQLDEGGLSEMRSCLVSRKACEKYFEKLQLVEYLVVKKGFEKLKNTTSVLAGALEAVIGAIYLDGGFESARKFIYVRLGETMLDMLRDPPRNYKSLLQEYVNSHNQQVEYVQLSCKGPSHQREFIYRVVVDQQVIGQGQGVSKKEAQQKAAKEALAYFGVLEKQEEECLQDLLEKAREKIQQWEQVEENQSGQQQHFDSFLSLVNPKKDWNVQSWNSFQHLMHRKYKNMRTIQASIAVKNILFPLASTFDQNGTFARESYIRCQLEAIPAAVVPSKYGGEDISMLECLQVLIELSSGCTSTAYGFAHHFAAVGFLRDWSLSYASPVVEDLFWEVALRQSFCYAVMPPLISKSNPLIVLEDKIQGMAQQVVAGPLIDFFITFPRIKRNDDQEEEKTSSVGMFLVPKSSTKVHKWVTDNRNEVGLRASGLSSIVFHYQGGQWIARNESEISLALLLCKTWHLACMNAVYIGLAKAAIEQVKENEHMYCIEYLQLESGLMSIVKGWNQVTWLEQRHAICDMLERYYLSIVPQVRRLVRTCYEKYPENAHLERLNRDCNVGLFMEELLWS